MGGSGGAVLLRVRLRVGGAHGRRLRGQDPQGRQPADLPVEQPTKFEFAINQKTTKALGLTIPQSVLLRANEIIQ